MGGSRFVRRVVRHVILLTAAGLAGAVFIAPAVADPGSGNAGGGVPAAPRYRVTLAPAGPAGALDATFVAVVERSSGTDWAPAAGETVAFAYVTDGAGTVTAVNGGPVGDMSAVTDGDGRATLTVRSDGPGLGAVAATTQGQTATAAA